MISIYLTSSVLGLLFSIIFYEKKQKDQEYSYAKSCVWGSYLLLRLLLLLMLPDQKMTCCVAIGLELLLFWGIGYMVEKQLGKKTAGCLTMHYVYAPVVPVLLVYGQLKGVLELLCLTLLSMIGIQELKRRGQSLLRKYPAYVLGMASFTVFLYGKKELGQSIKMLNGRAGIPWAMLLGFFLATGAVAAYGICGRIPQKLRTESPKEDMQPEQPVKLTGYHICDMVILTGIMFLILVYRVGSMNVPVTEYWMYQSDESREIVLDFGKNVKISKISVFLGPEAKKKVSLSYPSDGKWVVYDSEHELTSVFAWNDLSVNGTVNSMGIVLTDDRECLREMVILDEDGKKLIPENADRYAKLFDEQETYPETPTYYEETMFDEVYHGRTAYEFLHGLSIYENTHPPLGKILISCGIAIFGMNPFGWRIVSVCCGAMMIPFAYLFGFRLGKRRRFAWLSALLLMTGFMHFTLSRIATIDIIVGLFLLAVYYYMFCFITTGKKGYLWLDGIALALAVSTKWTGFYGAAGIAVVFFLWFFETYGGQLKEQKREIGKLAGICMVAFVGIPAVVYTLSYIPFARVYPDKNLIQHVISNGVLMLNYHSHTVFAHPYESAWYEWIMDRVPLLDAWNRLPDGRISVVKTMLNPLIAWGGIPALLFCVFRWRMKGDKRARTLVLFYLSVLIPWLGIHRTVFIYQYFGPALILVLCICYAVSHVKRNQRLLVYLICAGSVLLFLEFYPELSGYPVSERYLNLLKWLPRW